MVILYFFADLVVQAKSGTGKTCVFATIALDALVLENLSTQVSARRGGCNPSSSSETGANWCRIELSRVERMKVSHQGCQQRKKHAHL